MKLEIDEQVLLKHNLTASQFIILHGLYYNNLIWIKSLFTKESALKIRNTLVGTDYILSDDSTSLSHTAISKHNIGKLLGVKGDNINFWEWYQVYPVKVGTRVLRASTNTAVIAEKHKIKYLKKVKTEEQHQKAIASTENFIAIQKQAGKLNFLPNIETVLNNALWENWEALIPTKNKEGLQWNETTI